MYISRKCITLIYALSKSAKLCWGLSHEALKTIHKGAILPLLLYGVPAWIETLEKECNRLVFNRVQCHIKIAKAFRTTSNKALCTLTGVTPIVIRTEEEDKLYNIMTKSQDHVTVRAVQPKD
jgi:hypothetical protein